MITSVALRMCRGHIYVLGQPLWQLWQRSPALLSFPQCDVRTLLQYNPCLSTSQALCRLGGGLRPRWWRKAPAGRDSFPPGSVYIFYNNVCCPQTTWLSYQCKEQLNPHSAECFHYSYSWSWRSRPSALWSSLLFHYWLIYTLNRDSKRGLILCIHCDHLGVAAWNTVLRKILRLHPDSAGWSSEIDWWGLP